MTSQPSNNALQPLLALHAISKHFGATRALSNVDFQIFGGEVHGLIGENGSGKSTLVKVAYGEILPDSGMLQMDQATVHFKNPHVAEAHGIVAVAQEVPLVGTLTVAENITLNHQPRKWGLISRRLREEQAAAALDRFGARIDPRAYVRDLPAHDKQLVSIARALSLSAKILILDEPTSSLSSERVERLFAIIEQLRSEGLGIVFISQRLPDIRAIAARVTVLRGGLSVANCRMTDVSDSEITSLMIGREIEDYYHRRITRSPGPVTLTVDKVGVAGATSASLKVHRGEIVGIAGLVGSGRSDLARAIAGAQDRETGVVLVDNQEVPPNSPRHAIALGIGFVSGDRKTEGLDLEASVERNLTIVKHRHLSLRPIRRRSDAVLSRTVIQDLDIRPAAPEQRARALSGGNQQKVVLGKWFGENPRVLVLDEPTRGVDVGAKAEIYRRLQILADEGAAILVSSSENSELVGLCDRVYVLFNGSVVAELTGDDLTEMEVSHYAAGAGSSSRNESQ